LDILWAPLAAARGEAEAERTGPLDGLFLLRGDAQSLPFREKQLETWLHRFLRKGPGCCMKRAMVVCFPRAWQWIKMGGRLTNIQLRIFCVSSIMDEFPAEDEVFFSPIGTIHYLRAPCTHWVTSASPVPPRILFGGDWAFTRRRC
jgi:hypothetical protein